MLKKFAVIGTASLLALSPLAAQAGLTLSSSYALAAGLGASSSNFNPQGMGFDASANELLFVQQSTNSIVRTDLSGNIVGTRTIGAIQYSGSGTTNTANHVVSVAADADYYYFSDYTANSNGKDIYRIGKTTGAASVISAETAAFGGDPIDVRGGMLYRTNSSSTYGFSNLHQIRTSSIAAPDTTLATLTLGGAGIADFAVDTLHSSIWVLDYLASASIRRFDISTGALLDTYALGVDGLTAGLTYANNKLYYYDWNQGNGSVLKTYATGLADAPSAVPEPSSLLLLGAAMGALFFVRRRKQA